MRQDGLAGSRLCPHAESFSCGGRDAAAQSGRRDEMVAGHLHQSLQPASQALRSLVLRALQVADRGRIGQQLSQERGRLRPLESGAGETGGGGCALDEFCLEQLAGVLARTVEPSGLVAGASVAGRVGHPRGQSGRAATA